MQPKHTTYVTSYHARFTVNNVNCNLKAESLTELQNLIGRCLQGENIRFDAARSSNTHSIIFNDEWVGYISKTEVPETMTVRSESETRRAQERAA